MAVNISKLVLNQYNLKADWAKLGLWWCNKNITDSLLHMHSFMKHALYEWKSDDTYQCTNDPYIPMVEVITDYWSLSI